MTADAPFLSGEAVVVTPACASGSEATTRGRVVCCEPSSCRGAALGESGGTGALRAAGLASARVLGNAPVAPAIRIGPPARRVENELQMLSSECTTQNIEHLPGTTWIVEYETKGDVSATEKALIFSMVDFDRRSVDVHAILGETEDLECKGLATALGHAVLQVGDHRVLSCGGSSLPSIREYHIPKRIAQVACGSSHTLVLDVEGTVWAWGDNHVGQLGIDDVLSVSSPMPVRKVPRAGRVAAGPAHSVAVDADSTSLFAWGLNSNGQCGFSPGTTVIPVPDEVMQVGRVAELGADGNSGDEAGGDAEDSAQNVRIVAVAAASHTAIVLSDGRIIVCGDPARAFAAKHALDEFETDDGKATKSLHPSLSMATSMFGLDDNVLAAAALDAPLIHISVLPHSAQNVKHMLLSEKHIVLQCESTESEASETTSVAFAASLGTLPVPTNAWKKPASGRGSAVAALCLVSRLDHDVLANGSTWALHSTGAVSVCLKDIPRGEFAFVKKVGAGVAAAASGALVMSDRLASAIAGATSGVPSDVTIGKVDIRVNGECGPGERSHSDAEDTDGAESGSGARVPGAEEPPVCSRCCGAALATDSASASAKHVVDACIGTDAPATASESPAQSNDSDVNAAGASELASRVAMLERDLANEQSARAALESDRAKEVLALNKRLQDAETVREAALRDAAEAREAAEAARKAAAAEKAAPSSADDLLSLPAIAHYTASQQPPWVPDDAATACQVCKTKFNAALFKLKHHCRCCGRVTCRSCLVSQRPLPGKGYRDAVKICSLCAKS